MTKILVYDAFTEKAGMGNPAGIVFDTRGMSDSRMQAIAKELGYNESAFICRDEDGALRLRYFTPGQEVPLCGHATVASLCAMAERGMLNAGTVSVRTAAGALTMEIRPGPTVQVGMEQTPYREIPFTGDRGALAELIGLREDMLDERFPVCYASTGLWTLLLPVRKLEDFRKMRPETLRFPEVLTQMERASVHPFCLETCHADCVMHGRHFSSPFSETVEDPVTGTASGAMGAYYQRHICPGAAGSRIRIEQGQEIGKDGTVEVEIPDSPGKAVRIFGTAVRTAEKEIE